VDPERVPSLDKPMLDRALQVISDATAPDALDLLNESATDGELWERATADPSGFLEERGVRLPENIELRLVSETREIPWPRPDRPLELVVIRTFWWCYREDDEGPPTCVRVSLEVPARLIRRSG
jgi:hypothetical protein